MISLIGEICIMFSRFGKIWLNFVGSAKHFYALKTYNDKFLPKNVKYFLNF
jgi:hypothetical protein